jgi:hypothetical protein
MLDALRPLRVLALTIAFTGLLADSASATGPGGWCNLGAQAGAPTVPAV